MTDNSQYTTSMDITDLNYQKALLHLPTIILLGMLLIIGIVGNTLVLYVYIWKIRPSNHRIFIIFLGVVDLTACIAGMPFIMYQLIYPLMQSNKWECKISVTIAYIMVISSVMILMVIAFDRYLKVCKPLRRQMSITQAKMCCIVAIVISVIASLPVIELFGLNTVQTKNPKLKGTRCYIADAYINTNHFVTLSAMSALLIFITLLMLSVFYCLVSLTIRQQTKKVDSIGLERTEVANHRVQNSSSPPLSNNRVQNCTENPDINTTGTSQCSPNNSNEIRDQEERETGIRNLHQNLLTKRSSSSRRITVMLFTISVVFFVSYVPHIILQLNTSLHKDFEENLGEIEYCIYTLVSWSFFINNVANPIIYGFCDKRFLKHIKKLCCACARTQPE